MDEIFTHHDSPFFKSAIPLTVNPLSYEEFSKFLKKKFNTGQHKTTVTSKAGIHAFQAVADRMDSGFHRSDEFLRVHQFYLIGND
ncbi:MAG: hypothetical protein JRJ57_12055, partial [Deltaproteobacteria bacterium]|nr:hypothetical protein [Deltaproteobacteria bacterium]